MIICPEEAVLEATKLLIKQPPTSAMFLSSLVFLLVYYHPEILLFLFNQRFLGNAKDLVLFYVSYFIGIWE